MLSNYRAFPVERQDVLPFWPRLKSSVAPCASVTGRKVTGTGPEGRGLSGRPSGVNGAPKPLPTP